MKEIEELIELSIINDKIDIKRKEDKFLSIEWAVNELLSEIREVKEEIKPNNTPFLEDELGDIVWGWMMLVQKLKAKGLVTSHENIIKRALKKYQERILSLTGTKSDYEVWNKIKKEQKHKLIKESKKELKGSVKNSV